VPEQATIRVLVGEDSLLVRQGVERIIASAPELELVGSCGDLDSLRMLVRERRPSVVVTDIRMPPGHSDEGITLANELREDAPDVAVVVLSQHESPLYARALLRAGTKGRGYVLKERLADARQLVEIVRDVAAGGSYLDPDVLEVVLGLRGPVVDLLRNLTPREREVLALIAEGRSNVAIAAQLSISRRGVERHVNSIFAKLGVAGSTDVSPRVKAAMLYRDPAGWTRRPPTVDRP
jgi:DNA-binding NarL/FixJ family response regulator